MNFKKYSTIPIPLEQLDILDEKDIPKEMEDICMQIRQNDDKILMLLRENLFKWNDDEWYNNNVKDLVHKSNLLRKKLWDLGIKILQRKRNDEENRVVLDELRVDELRSRVKEIKETKNYKTPKPIYKMNKKDLVKWLKIALWKELNEPEPSLKEKEEWLS